MGRKSRLKRERRQLEDRERRQRVVPVSKLNPLWFEIALVREYLDEFNAFFDREPAIDAGGDEGGDAELPEFLEIEVGDNGFWSLDFDGREWEAYPLTEDLDFCGHGWPGVGMAFTSGDRPVCLRDPQATPEEVIEWLAIAPRSEGRYMDHGRAVG